MGKEHNDRKGPGKWRGRGRGRGRGGGHGRGGWSNKPYSNNQNTNHQSDKEDKPPSDSNKRDVSDNSTSTHYFPKKNREFSYSQMIPEEDLGITESIYKEKKIDGILKQKYSDFIVHEIDPDGNIVKLTTLEVPEESEAENNLVSERDSIISDEKWQELTRLLEKPKDGESAPKEIKIEVTELDKDSRRNIHSALKKVFGIKIQSNTLDLDGKKFIVVKKSNGSDLRWARGKDKEYLHFVLYKQDRDTSETVNHISYKLRFKPSNLNFAGTKDRRACTSQKMSLWHGEPKRFEKLGIWNVSIGNYEFKGKTIKLGQLKGNLFSIALREISSTDEDVSKAMASLKENGFINYYGTQRFGTNKDAPTYEVGKALLQGDWEKAVNLILHPRDNFAFKEALECWKKEKNGKKALSLVKGQYNSVEVSLLKGLAGSGKNDYLNALNKLPRNLRLLYLHAYQSLVWNRIVSRRIRQFGLKTLPGDLVLVEGSSAEADFDTLAEGSDLKVDIVEADENDGTVLVGEVADSKNAADCKVRVISSEEADKIPIDKIVLPTPGFKITLPQNEVKEWYSELLAEDGFTVESLRQKSKEYSVGGSYRNIVGKPSRFDWKIFRYKEPDCPLLRTDLEALKGEPEPQDDPEGTLRALIVEFGLDVSTYATIALREVVDYVGAHQKKIEENAKNKEGEPESTETEQEAANQVTVRIKSEDDSEINLSELDASRDETTTGVKDNEPAKTSEVVKRIAETSSEEKHTSPKRARIDVEEEKGESSSKEGEASPITAKTEELRQL